MNAGIQPLQIRKVSEAKGYDLTLIRGIYKFVSLGYAYAEIRFGGPQVCLALIQPLNISTALVPVKTKELS